MKLSKREASGAVSLVILIILVQTVIFITQPEVVKEPAVNESAVGELIAEDSTAKELRLTEQVVKEQVRIKKVTKNGAFSSDRELGGSSIKEGSTFQFDPNTVTLEELVKLGLTPKQASVVINYRSKGGVFKKREDFKKIYVLPQGFYERVKDYIEIEPQKNDINKLQTSSLYTANKELIELNGADSIELLELPGIGPYYAKKIIEYREKSGGILSAEELTNIKGIDSIRFSLFANMVFVDTLNIVKKDLNRATLYELSQHPHIGPYLARSIVRFRELSGKEGITLAILVLNKIVAPELFKKLKYFFN